MFLENRRASFAINAGQSGTYMKTLQVVLGSSKEYRFTMTSKGKRHSRRNVCSNCGKHGKIHNHKSYVVFICSCGKTESAPDIAMLKQQLKGNIILNVASTREVTIRTQLKCQNPNHPSFRIRKDGTCPKAHKCPDYHSKGCVST